MRRGRQVRRLKARALIGGVCFGAISALPALALTQTPPAANVTLKDGQVSLQSNNSTQLQMYLPNAGALAGGDNSAVLAAAFSMKKAGTSITVKSGYHARNRKAIAGYMAAHSPEQQGWRGSLGAHWANEADLYNDVRQGGYQALPSLELESLHELGINRTLASGLSMGVTARSKSNEQSITAQLGYKRGGVVYDGMLTKNMFGGAAMRGHQRLQVALGKVQLDGGLLMRTARTGMLETFPSMSARMAVKGVDLNASFKRDPKLRLAGRAIESTALTITKAFFDERLQLSSAVNMRRAAIADGLVSARFALSFSAPKDNGKLSWRVGASALHLDGGAASDLTASALSPGEALRSTLSALSANIGYQINKKTQVNFKAAAKHLASDMGDFQRVTLSSHVKHGLWDFEAMAGLNRSSADTAQLINAQGSLHHFFAQRSFGQFSDQRAIFSLKAKYSY
ncbi:MAG: hypothetical protein AAF221_14965 [Pseudomonadota bacterium]